MKIFYRCLIALLILPLSMAIIVLISIYGLGKYNPSTATNDTDNSVESVQPPQEETGSRVIENAVIRERTRIIENSVIKIPKN